MRLVDLVLRGLSRGLGLINEVLGFEVDMLDCYVFCVRMISVGWYYLQR